MTENTVSNQISTEQSTRQQTIHDGSATTWGICNVCDKTLTKTDEQSWTAIPRRELIKPVRKIMDESSYVLEYPKWQPQKRSPTKRPQGELKVGEGQLDTLTVQKQFFTGNTVQRRSPIKREGELKLKDLNKYVARVNMNGIPVIFQKMNSRSVKANLKKMNSRSVKANLKVDLKKISLENLSKELDLLNNRMNSRSVKASLKVGEGKFEGRPASQDDFKGKPVERPQQIRRKSEHIWDTGDIACIKDDFKGEPVERPQQIREPVERPQQIRRKSEHEWDTGDIVEETSNKADYPKREPIKREIIKKPEDELKISLENLSKELDLLNNRMNSRSVKASLKEGLHLKMISKVNQSKDLNKFVARVNIYGIPEGLHLKMISKGKPVERPQQIRRKNLKKISLENLSKELDLLNNRMNSRSNLSKELDLLNNRMNSRSVKASLKEGLHLKMISKGKPVERPQQITSQDQKMNSRSVKANLKVDLKKISLENLSKELDLLNNRMNSRSVKASLKEGLHLKMISKGKPVERPQQIRRKSEHIWDTGDIVEETSNKADYPKREPIKREIIKKPEDELKVGEGKFEGRPKEDFTGEPVQRTRLIKQPDELKVGEGKFEGRPASKMISRVNQSKDLNKLRRKSEHIWDTGDIVEENI
ncbi:hypothetical protein GQR58_025247 [Nymphon striatum]|nr:hypothetical protein GQR58_025247 [Nymphon striatum]